MTILLLFTDVKRKVSSEVLKEVGALMKLYQEEVDKLSNRLVLLATKQFKNRLHHSNHHVQSGTHCFYPWANKMLFWIMTSPGHPCVLLVFVFTFLDKVYTES